MGVVAAERANTTDEIHPYATPEYWDQVAPAAPSGLGWGDTGCRQPQRALGGRMPGSRERLPP